MSSEDQETSDDEEITVEVESSEEADADSRGRLEERADRAVEGFDQGIIDLLSWVLDTETKARIYVYLRQESGSTSEEIAEGTGLYPSTVREALAELNEEGTVEREKRESEGAGNNPYEYTAIAPSDLVSGMVQQVQDELNAVINLDRYLGGGDIDAEAETEPITITVDNDEGGVHEEDRADEGVDEPSQPDRTD